MNFFRLSPFLPASIMVTGVGVILSATGWGQTSYSPIVGFAKVTINGTANGTGDNFVGPGFSGKPEYQGALDAGVPVANQVTDSTAAWSAGQFATHPTQPSHCVVILASSNAAAVGRFADIVSHTATTLTLAQDLSGVLQGGESYVIRKLQTVAALFGTANESGLGQGTATSADTISVLAPGASPAFSSYYYRNGAGFGGDGWRSTANPVTDQAQAPIRLGQGLLIKRRQAAAMEVVLHGYVHEGPLQLPVQTGYNLIDPLAPTTDQSASGGPRFTLGGTAGPAVIPSALDALLAPGSPTTADLLSIHDGASAFTAYYFRDAGLLNGGGWRTTLNSLTDRASVVLPPSAAYLFQIRSAGGIWNRPQPFGPLAP